MDSIKYDDFLLREVKPEDKDILYHWANDSQTRQNSFSSREITYEEHERWFQKTLNSKKRIQMIMEKNGVPVGQIRIDIDGKVGEIGYAIAPEYRGRGYGAIICKLMVEYARNKLRICKLIARVKNNNIASKRCFIKNGFDNVYEQFELDI